MAPSLFMKWAKPVRNSKNQGLICHYCYKTYLGRFAILYPKVEMLVEALGRDSEAKFKFNHYCGFAVHAMQESKSWGARTPWNHAEQQHKTLTHHQEHLTQLIGPEAKAMEYADYCQVYGDPAKTGRGLGRHAGAEGVHDSEHQAEAGGPHDRRRRRQQLYRAGRRRPVASELRGSWLGHRVPKPERRTGGRPLRQGEPAAHGRRSRFLRPHGPLIIVIIVVRRRASAPAAIAERLAMGLCERCDGRETCIPTEE